MRIPHTVTYDDIKDCDAKREIAGQHGGGYSKSIYIATVVDNNGNVSGYFSVNLNGNEKNYDDLIAAIAVFNAESHDALNGERKVVKG